MGFKLPNDGYNTMIEELTKNQGPFSKTGNVMLALDQIAKGEDLNQVTKQHLINIMKSALF